jgi:ABC-type dipeptide/oligopeptide/nickel transport system permease subunit
MNLEYNKKTKNTLKKGKNNMQLFYKNILLWVIFATLFCTLFIPFFLSKEIDINSIEQPKKYWIHPPTVQHILLCGTYQNYNMLYVILTATKTTLKISILSLILSILGGLTLIFCNFHKNIGSYFNPIAKIMTYFPRLFFLIILTYIFKLQETSQLLFSTSYYLILMFGIIGSFFIFSQTSPEINILQSKIYIQFSRSLGWNEFWIFLKHILPNCPLLPISIVKQMRDNILFLSILTFIGCVHLQPEDLGSLICRLVNDPSVHQEGWWILFFPCFFLTWLILLLDLMGQKIAKQKKIINP